LCLLESPSKNDLYQGYNHVLHFLVEWFLGVNIFLNPYEQEQNGAKQEYSPKTKIEKG